MNNSVIPNGADHRDSGGLRSGGTLCSRGRLNRPNQAKSRHERTARPASVLGIASDSR
jgi:hypothetical protein